MSFKIWLEMNLRRDQQAEVQRIYDMAVKTLLGAARDQTQLSLSDIEGDANDGPPSHKGPQAVFDKLNRAQIFQRLKGIGDPEIATRVDQTQRYLNSTGDSGQVGPKKTVGQLLMMLFGDDALDTYGDHKWKISPPSQTQRPPEVAPPPTPQQPNAMIPNPGGPMPPQPAAPMF